MTRDRILVTGANGNLGRALLRELGPERALAAVRAGRTVLPGFEQVTLGADGALPAEVLARCDAVINAAGSVTGSEAQLAEANVRLPAALAQAARAAGVRKFVQVSSFSIFGAAEQIDETTADGPINDYGRSKAAAEAAILPLARDGFAVECLRLPFMFSAEKPALLGPLLKLATRLRVLPVAAERPFQRSMITYADTARQLVASSERDTGGTVSVADPRLFDYPLLQRILSEEAAIRISLLSLPRLAVAGVDRLLPTVGRRLFRSSVLSPRFNLAGKQPLNLEHELRQLVRAGYGRGRGRTFAQLS